jgi:methylated-DNA-[protein]-cysteine S-methyltransferase
MEERLVSKQSPHLEARKESHTEIATPLGVLRLVARGQTLCALEFTESRKPRTGDGFPRKLQRRLRAYFDGDLHALDDIDVAPAGTDFERRVWRLLRRIPPGRTLSYGELAHKLGVPGAARAVGGACGRNPIALVIPCHRVIGADGSVTGYGGGVERKRWLLRHESAQGGLFSKKD